MTIACTACSSTRSPRRPDRRRSLGVGRRERAGSRASSRGATGSRGFVAGVGWEVCFLALVWVFCGCCVGVVYWNFVVSS
jgi:hypothetical protein